MQRGKGKFEEGGNKGDGKQKKIATKKVVKIDIFMMYQCQLDLVRQSL
jgi:hypothetical protein